MALWARQYDGQGRHVDISEAESMLPTMATPINRFSFEGQVESRAGRVHGQAPFDFYRVKDGYASIFLVQEAHWDRFVALMGSPAWAKAEMFTDRRTRAQYKEDLAALMEPWLREQRNDELYVKAQAMDIPIGPARTMDEVLADRHFAERGVFRRARHPELGPVTWLHPPYRSSRGPWPTPPPAPELGQHTAEVLASWLGLSRRDLAGLAAAGVI
jgi:formyl-CoA transferase